MRPSATINPQPRRGPAWITGAWSWLFSMRDGDDSAISVVLWWESRRIPYNLIIAAVGVPSFVAYFLFIIASGELKPGEDAIEPIALMVAPFAINIAYTAGWMAELGLRPFYRSRRTGPMLLAVGLALSLFVALSPAVIWGIVVLVKAA